MGYYNEECKPWCMLSDSTQRSISESENAKLMNMEGGWSFVKKKTFFPNEIVRARILGRPPLVSEDIKQGDVIKRKHAPAWEWSAIEPFSGGVVLLATGEHIDFEYLQEYYLIRSINDSCFRGCSR